MVEGRGGHHQSKVATRRPVTVHTDQIGVEAIAPPTLYKWLKNTNKINTNSIGGRVFTHWQTICSSVIYKRERVVKSMEFENGNGFSSNGFQSANAIYMTSIE